MRELIRSVIGYSWAMSVLGVQQICNLLAPEQRCANVRKVNSTFYNVTQATEDQFDALALGSFQIGDDLQRSLIDLVFDSVTLRAFNPGYLSQLGSDLAEQSKETLRTFTSIQDTQLAWEQLRNSYEVFNLVRNVGSLLHIPAGTECFDLGKLVQEAYALGQYPDLWAVEGLGHDYAMTFFPRWGKGEHVHGILTDERAGVLPRKSLTMMHAGLGLAFAQQLLGRITPYSPDADVASVLDEFVRLVKDNSRAGYEGAAYESLGLVTRFRYSQLVKGIDKQLRTGEPGVLDYFWHGAGRAFYFLPLYFVPGLLSPWIAIEREAPHELALLNLTAGLSWAMTIVNIRQPRIIENFLRYQGERVAQTPAFSNGVVSALIMGLDITPGDVYVKKFLEYQPQSNDQKVAQLWDKLVSGPANAALEHIYPELKSHDRLGEIFRFQDLPELAECLSRFKE